MAKLTPTELGQVQAGVRRNIRKIMADVTPDELLKGSVWYMDAHEEATFIAETYGLSVLQAAGLIAVLSPRQRWKANVDDAHLMAAGEPAINAMGGPQAKGRGVIAGDLDQIRGPKVTRFFRNILEPFDSMHVTLDTWMVKAVVPERWTFGYSDPYKFLERVGVYEAVQRAFQSEAERMNMMPHQLQAAVWVHVRGAHE